MSCTAFKAEEKHEDVTLTSEDQKNESPEVLEKFAKEYGWKINPNLTTKQRYGMLQLLFTYRDVFARSLGEMKRYPHYELEVDLLSNRKYSERQYKLSQEDEIEAERQIQEMVQYDIIENAANADYNSPIFLVGKKDGSRRMVIDMRGVNALLVPKLVQLH